MGDHTKHGSYVIDWNKVRTYVVPRDLKSCNVSREVWHLEGRLLMRLLSLRLSLRRGLIL